jgi:hypothetical protein
MVRTATLGLILCVVVGFCVSPVAAGLLDTGTPIAKGTDEWSGTTSFANGTLSGWVDWAVFAPGAFPFSGYTPQDGEVTYVYQIHCTGTAHISFYGVYLENDADNVGYFSDSANGVTGATPSHVSLSEYDQAGWTFGTGGGIAQGSTSCGLVFSSPNLPMDYTAICINGGRFAIVEPVPSPSPDAIPEPATIWLLGSALSLMLGAYWLRRS